MIKKKERKIMEIFPTIFLPKVIEWNLEDPKGKSIEKVREIRDEIEERVKELVSAITVAP